MTDHARDAEQFDLIVIGAGFGGLYAVHRFRAMGLRVVALEKGDGVGGVWFWNRYPGCRVDVHGVEYSYSFSPEIEQEWDWSEVMPTQPEIERYLNFVADRLDLRRDIRCGTTVTAARWDDAHHRWTITTAAGDTLQARFVVAATGQLSAPLTPDIPGLDTFEGVLLSTAAYPRGGFDFTGLRAGVIGTGSSGVQAIPLIAEQAAHLHVFQRSAAFTRPAHNRPIGHDEMQAIKADYADLRRRLSEAFSGTLHVGAVTTEAVPDDQRILRLTRDERMAKIDELGWSAPFAWADVLVDVEANRAGVEVYGELVRRAVHDPAVAAALVPDYPIGCKRPVHDTGYFATFNRDDVTLVDLRRTPIVAVNPRGIETTEGQIDLDVLVLATGFDAITGALTRIDIAGRDGRVLRDVWADDGPATMLGLVSAGFPNLFMITGPGSPSVHINVVAAVEYHVDFVADCLTHMAERGFTAVEAEPAAQAAWTAVVQSLVDGTIRASEGCDSWYLGTNVPGKRRAYMTYVGGQVTYKARCAEVVAAGYRGFAFA